MLLTVTAVCRVFTTDTPEETDPVTPTMREVMPKMMAPAMLLLRGWRVTACSSLVGTSQGVVRFTGNHTTGVM